MNEQDFQERLGELIEQVGGLPTEERDRLKSLADKTKDRHDKLRQTVDGLQDSLDYLRLSVKYLVFDLEATRRENEYLRRVINDQAKRQRSDENN